MKTIPLTQGQQAIVDDGDHEALSVYKWSAARIRDTFYATRQVTLSSHKRVRLYMHRSIMQPPDGLEVDHIDGNPLNNQRSNLRLVTALQNQFNRTRKQLGTSSRYRGVTWNKCCNRWQAQIQMRGRTAHIGLFTDEEMAARAYDAAGFERDPVHFTPNFPTKNSDSA